MRCILSLEFLCQTLCLPACLSFTLHTWILSKISVQMYWKGNLLRHDSSQLEYVILVCRQSSMSQHVILVCPNFHELTALHIDAYSAACVHKLTPGTKTSPSNPSSESRPPYEYLRLQSASKTGKIESMASLRWSMDEHSRTVLWMISSTTGTNNQFSTCCSLHKNPRWKTETNTTRYTIAIANRIPGEDSCRSVEADPIQQPSSLRSSPLSFPLLNPTPSMPPRNVCYHQKPPQSHLHWRTT